jgi:hypothetical protein
LWKAFISAYFGILNNGNLNVSRETFLTMAQDVSLANTHAFYHAATKTGADGHQCVCITPCFTCIFRITRRAKTPRFITSTSYCQNVSRETFWQ